MQLNSVNKIIVSLTSYPARIKTVNQTIESLINQTQKADKIILWLAISQFPNKEADLPHNLILLTSKNLSIEWIDDDIKSYKKLLPALKKYPDNVIITVDDDYIYPPYLIEKLYCAYINDTNNIHCGRGHIIVHKNGYPLPYKKWLGYEMAVSKPSYLNFFTGVGGILYPPNVLHKDLHNKDIFLKLTPFADDIWFWAMAVKQKTKINFVYDTNFNHNYIYGTQNNNSLSNNNYLKNDNDKQLSAILKYYPEIIETLKKEKIERKKVSFRQLFINTRRKLVRFLIGKELYNNLQEINRIYESIIKLNNSITEIKTIIQEINNKLD